MIINRRNCNSANYMLIHVKPISTQKEGILKKGAKLVEISFLFTKFFELDQNSRKQKRMKGESMKKKERFLFSREIPLVKDHGLWIKALKNKNEATMSFVYIRSWVAYKNRKAVLHKFCHFC